MNIPLLPDKSYKLFVYLGIGLTIYAWISGQNFSDNYEKKRIEYNVEVKKLNNEIKYLKIERENIGKKAESLAKTYSVKNPLNVNDSGYVFIRTLRGNKEEMAISDSINVLLENYKLKSLDINKNRDLLDIKEYELESLFANYKEIKGIYTEFSVFGMLLLALGIVIWYMSDEFEMELKKRKNIDKPTYSRYCQSCSKEFNSMIRYGTEDDGRNNYHFCKSCYENGKFNEPDISLDVLKVRLTNELKEKNKSTKEIEKFVKRLKSVDRWK